MSIAPYLDIKDIDLPVGTTLLATVTEETNPALPARVRVCWEDENGAERSMWVARLQGLVPRLDDRVIVTFPGNGAEPVVTGVLDSLASTPDPRRTGGPNLTLKQDERLQISGPDGKPWLEVEAHPEGPRLRFLVSPEGLDLPGTVKISGDAVELKARKGEIRLDASGDVRVVGEIVRLN